MLPSPVKQNPELPQLAKGEDPGASPHNWTQDPTLEPSCLAECRLGQPPSSDWRLGTRRGFKGNGRDTGADPFPQKR